ncbi:unnamed protein product, partial [Didymodactylos carnosus]
MSLPTEKLATGTETSAFTQTFTYNTLTESKKQIEDEIARLEIHQDDIKQALKSFIYDPNSSKVVTLIFSSSMSKTGLDEPDFVNRMFQSSASLVPLKKLILQVLVNDYVLDKFGKLKFDHIFKVDEIITTIHSKLAENKVLLLSISKKKGSH